MALAGIRASKVTDLLIAMLLAGVAVYRVAKMVATEEGPFGLFLKLRNRFLGDSWLDRGLHCPLCMGFWLSGIPALLLSGATGFWLWLPGFWLAIAGVQTFLEELA